MAQKVQPAEAAVGVAAVFVVAVGVGVEVGQLAVDVAARDARALQQRFEAALMPAVAARDPRDTVNIDRLPSGVVADRTGHGRW